jgi:hypothetical protein
MRRFLESLLGNSRHIVSSELADLRRLAAERRHASLRMVNSRVAPEGEPETFLTGRNAAKPLTAERN